MRKYFSRFWILITIAICVLFLTLFLPATLKSIGTAKAISYGLTGVAVIWIVYFVRAHIFSGFNNNKKDEDPSSTDEEQSENNSS